MVVESETGEVADARSLWALNAMLRSLGFFSRGSEVTEEF